MVKYLVPLMRVSQKRVRQPHSILLINRLDSYPMFPIFCKQNSMKLQNSILVDQVSFQHLRKNDILHDIKNHLEKNFVTVQFF